MTLQQLKYVLKIANTNSMNQASKDLNITQPTLTNAIKKLEEEFHITLFRRTHMGVLLTREGHEFMKYAKEVIQKADLLEAHYQKGDPSLSSFSENGKRIFWTRQHISVARILRTEQIYRMKREFLVSKNGSMADYYATLYEWYTEKARQRLTIASDLKYPIWLYLTDDIIYQPIENTVVLELELPDDAYLLCDSEKWCYRMNYFYIPKDEEDEKNHLDELKKYHIASEDALFTTDEGNFYPLLKRKIIDGWSRLYTPPDSICSSTIGTCWEIRPEWVRRMLLYESSATFKY